MLDLLSSPFPFFLSSIFLFFFLIFYFSHFYLFFLFPLSFFSMNSFWYRCKTVTPRFSVRPNWRIRTEFGVRDHILRLFNCFLFFLFFISESKYQIHIQKNYHQSGVHQNLYTYTESHLQIQNCTFTFTNESTKPTVMNPYWCVGPAVCGRSRTYSSVPTRIKNPC